MGYLVVTAFTSLFVFTLHAQEPSATTSTPEGNSALSLPDTIAAAANPTPAAPTNLITNGSFAQSKAGWETRGTRTTIDGRTALEINTGRVDPQSLGFPIRIDRSSYSFRYSFEIKAEAGYATKHATGSGIKEKVYTPKHGYTYHDIDLKPGTEWQKFSGTFTVPENSPEFTFTIEIQPGKGSLYFTNFVVERKEN